ncbi:bZIP transcription factor [Plectosphaerella plurivora]|uniref:BZIP transcription factor n=1 Tax=Plectosphaerella plurivora TaxID=936078 RepID=A0A9P9AGW9_9PEZI|nr:bZIP transcription factor [Plectosphaerella plurivora]
MDFSQQYFVNAQPYQQFIGISPLTPSHSNSAASDDFNATSPPDVYAEYPADQQYNGFNGYPPHFAQNAPQPGFPGPPTPPNNHHVVQQQQHHAGAINGNAPAGVTAANLKQAAANAQHDAINVDDARRAGSNSDDDDENKTPAQARRKAQNRAAQRAFRERKEKHVKDLEAKLATLEASANQQSTENERLKREMQKMSTENEILRATSSMPGGPHSHSPEPRTTGPMQYNPTDFYSDLLAKHNNKTPSHRVVTSDDGERLLAAGATWDFIINHESFRRGLVDVGDVSERLKHQARCDGQGPVFAERSILDAIEASIASGSDELL